MQILYNNIKRLVCGIESRTNHMVFGCKSQRHKLDFSPMLLWMPSPYTQLAYAIQLILIAFNLVPTTAELVLQYGIE